MATKVRRADGYNHHVGRAGKDVLLAAGAEVGLDGLEGMDPADLHLFAGEHP